METDGVGLGIDDDTDGPVVVCHSDSEFEHEAKKLNTESLSLRRRVDGKSGKPEHWQGVSRQLLARAGREAVDLDVGGRDRGTAKHTSMIDGDICDAQVVPELVLSRKLLEEAIEVRVAGAEG